MHLVSPCTRYHKCWNMEVVIIVEFTAFTWHCAHLQVLLHEAVTAPPDFGSPVFDETTMDADDSTSDHGTGNPLRDGSMLDLARSVSTHRLTANEVHAIDHLALQIHQRLESSRAVPHHSDEYARGSWLMTRAYIARALEDTIASPQFRGGAGSSDPPCSADVDPGLN